MFTTLPSWYKLRVEGGVLLLQAFTLFLEAMSCTGSVWVHFKPYCDTAVRFSQAEDTWFVPGNLITASVSLCGDSRGCTAAVKKSSTSS